MLCVYVSLRESLLYQPVGEWRGSAAMMRGSVDPPPAPGNLIIQLGVPALWCSLNDKYFSVISLSAVFCAYKIDIKFKNRENMDFFLLETDEKTIIFYSRAFCL